MDFDTQAELLYADLNDSEKEMIQYIKSHKPEVINMTIIYRLFRTKICIKKRNSKKSNHPNRFSRNI